MFRTVRYWWSEGSGQRTARLFVFEFVVVLAGSWLPKVLVTGRMIVGSIAKLRKRMLGSSIRSAARNNMTRC